MKWTQNEIDYLKIEYAKIDGRNITNILERISKKLGRSKGSIRNKAYELKITHKEKYYTEKEIKFLKDNYNKISMNDMAEILKKNESNIYRKMKELGLKKTKRISNTINPKKVYRWTEKEKKKCQKEQKKILRKMVFRKNLHLKDTNTTKVREKNYLKFQKNNGQI